MKKLNYHTDLCPCGSGRVLKDCCLTKRNVTTPPGKKARYSNPRCYARALADCDRDLSREHYISESILTLRNKPISVTGFPWLDSGERRPISKASLTAKVLCARHNSALSGLDSTALQLFSYLMGTTKEESQEVLLINGEEIERWMLKALCGVLASGNVVHDSKQIRGWEPPPHWLEILFGSGGIPPDCGLYYIISGKYHLPANQFIMITPARNETSGDIVGISFVLEEFPFLFAMEPPPERDKPTPSGAELCYHLEGLQICTSNDVREVHFGWPEGRFIIIETNQG